jgi:glucose-1-phosphate adenylyltransferase
MLIAGNAAVREELLENRERPLFTKVRSLPPVRYGAGAEVESSLIADGCVVEGTVKNSVLFCGVHIGKGAIVENSIIMENCHLAERARIGSTILDKNVSLGTGVTLHGHPQLPFFVEEGKIIH